MSLISHTRLSLVTMTIGLALTACGGASELSRTQAVNPPVCGRTPTCTKAPLQGNALGFIKPKPSGDAWHFGRDYFLNETEDQWVIAKFQYGNYLFRKPLIKEDVEVQMLRSCDGEWEVLGSAKTTNKGEHPSVLGNEDEGGMIFFKIPEEKRLELGRHRLRLVVKGDQTATELYLEVLPQGTKLVVSDVDGTLTTSELIEGLASIFKTLPPAHSGAATQLQALAKKGYRPLYLTARSSNLVQRTRDFISNKKFPQGMVMTSSASTFGLSGAKGVAYKTAILQSMEERGFEIAYAFGNTAVDAEAFANANIKDDHKYFFKFDGYTSFGKGVKFDDYTLLTELGSAENLCEVSSLGL